MEAKENLPLAKDIATKKVIHFFNEKFIVELDKIVKDSKDNQFRLALIRVAKALHPHFMKLNPLHQDLKSYLEKDDRTEEDTNKIKELEEKIKEIYFTDVEIPLIDISSVKEELGHERISLLEEVFA